MIFKDFLPHSRIWLFISESPIENEKQLEIQHNFSNFSNNWKSHGEKLNGVLKIAYDKLIIIGVKQQNLCGRSVDGLMRFVRELDENVQLDLLNRNRLGYLVDGTLSTFHFNQIELLAKDGRINDNTLITNNFIQTNDQELFVSLSHSPFGTAVFS